jgi:hypothetical protein
MAGVSWLMLATVWFGAVAALVAGCQSGGDSSGQPAGNPFALMMAPAHDKGGSELWGENCTRCHNARPPQYYSDAQWDTIVHHMRLRANLTGEEARKIAEFLRSAN